MDGDFDTAASRLRALRAAMLGCVRCDALVGCRSQVVPGHGAAPATVAFVGLAPGRLGGDRTGIPFSGDRSGELLRLMIARADLGRVFITNVVRCNPRDGRGRNRDPSAREIANCRDHLAAELAAVRPRVVVCLGAVAWRETGGARRAISAAPSCRTERRRPAAISDVSSGLRCARRLLGPGVRTGFCAPRTADSPVGRAARHTDASSAGQLFRQSNSRPIWE